MTPLAMETGTASTWALDASGHIALNLVPMSTEVRFVAAAMATIICAIRESNQ